MGFQVLPFQKPEKPYWHCSAFPRSSWPTATQYVADRHLAPWSMLVAALPLPFGGTGTFLKVQILPFHT